MDIQCTFCRTELTGGVDTFGRLDEPMCASCYHELREAYRTERADSITLRAEEQQARAELHRLRSEHRGVKRLWRLNRTPRNRARLGQLTRQLGAAVYREEGAYWAVRMRPPSYDQVLAKGRPT